MSSCPRSTDCDDWNESNNEPKNLSEITVTRCNITVNLTLQFLHHHTTLWFPVWIKSVRKIFVSRTSLDWKSKWYRQMWWFLNRHIAFFPSPNVLQFTQHNLNFWLFFENLKTVLQWICVFLESFKQIFTSLYLNFKKLHQTCPETHYQKSIKSWAYIKFVTISFSVP